MQNVLKVIFICKLIWPPKTDRWLILQKTSLLQFTLPFRTVHDVTSEIIKKKSIFNVLTTLPLKSPHRPILYHQHVKNTVKYVKNNFCDPNSISTFFSIADDNENIGILNTDFIKFKNSKNITPPSQILETVHTFNLLNLGTTFGHLWLTSLMLSNLLQFHLWRKFDWSITNRTPRLIGLDNTSKYHFGINTNVSYLYYLRCFKFLHFLKIAIIYFQNNCWPFQIGSLKFVIDHIGC